MSVLAVRFFRHLAKRIVAHEWRPGPYLQNTVKRVTQGCVYGGPFKGMKYIDRSYCSALMHKLIGVYELEIQPQVERACHAAIDGIIDIGAAEGYYAAGFALRCPSTPVVAFELDENAREACELSLIHI